ncbi:MAG TPA: PRC-barrel domain-containing protein [Actinomycetota bacterium]|nr:PRC-barrel domain-containing protein [Actinomycetota bacterium]
MADEPISWMTLGEGTPVLAADGEEIGTVAEVVADRQKDIFSGIAVKSGLFANKRFVPADLIESMSANAVRVGLPATEADARLDPYP